MAARAGRDGNQAVCAFFDRFARKPVIDDVMQRNPAPAMHRLVQILARAERGDHDRHLPFRAGRQVGLEPLVGAVDDLVDREGRRRPVRIVPVMLRQFLGDAVQPFVQQALRPRVERRKGPDDPRLALGDHQFGTGDDEQRGPDHGQPQAIEQGRKAHLRFIAQLISLSSELGICLNRLMPY